MIANDFGFHGDVSRLRWNSIISILLNIIYRNKFCIHVFLDKNVTAISPTSE